MRKENKFLVTAWESIEEIVVIFDDDKNPYIYSYIDGDEFYRFKETEKIFDNKEQAEEYVRENIIPFDKKKSKSILLKNMKLILSVKWKIFYQTVLLRSVRTASLTYAIWGGVNVIFLEMH